jgi:hypothetical protein
MTKHLNPSMKRKFWENHVEEWKTSGLTQSEYCRQKSINRVSFGYWKKIIEQGNSALELVEVQLKALPVFETPPCPEFCIVLDQHFRIEIAKGFNPDDLEQVVRVLRRI